MRSLVFRVHASKRMLQRGIRAVDVEAVVAQGEIIEDYPDDTPFPSRLLLGSPAGLCTSSRPTNRGLTSPTS